MNDVTDLSRTIIAKSDQLNAEDLLSGPIVVTVQDVRVSDTPDQPVSILIGDGRQPYKPCKTMRRLLIFAWGKDGRQWRGRSMELYCDPDVTWGGVKIGGIRISALSHIETDFVLALSEKKGKRKPVHVKKLKTSQPAQESRTESQAPAEYPPELFAERFPAMRSQIQSGKMTAQQVIERCLKTGTLTQSQIDAIKAPFEQQHDDEEEF